MPRFSIILAITLATSVGLLYSQLEAAETVTFGSGPNTFQMEFAEIGSPGNAPDMTGNPSPAGAVSYTYQMGKFEVSEDMISKASAAGMLGLTAWPNRGANKPATGLNWFEAAIFVNWLNTSQGFQAAYDFDGGGNFQLWGSAEAWQLDGENLFRHKDAHYWLPSVDEWYKAAYYDPVAETYYDYPTGSDTAPITVAGGTAADTAVYLQPGSQGPADVTQAGGLSPFGTMGQGGNVHEWLETESDLVNDAALSARVIRGGDWFGITANLVSSVRGGFPPVRDDHVKGFRVASLSPSPVTVPEPTSLVVWIVTGIVAVWYAERRKRK